MRSFARHLISLLLLFSISLTSAGVTFNETCALTTANIELVESRRSRKKKGFSHGWFLKTRFQVTYSLRHFTTFLKIANLHTSIRFHLQNHLYLNIREDLKWCLNARLYNFKLLVFPHATE